MTRAQKIRQLQAAHLKAASQNKRLRARIIYARLSPLVTQQIKAEMRQERKAS